MVFVTHFMEIHQLVQNLFVRKYTDTQTGIQDRNMVMEDGVSFYILQEY